MSPNEKLDLLLCGLIAFTAFVGYVLYVRPVLKKNPSFGFLFAQEQKWGRAARLKLQGAKQRLMTAALIGVGFIVESYDYLSPFVAQSGVDMTKLSDKIPAQDWPFIMMAVLALIQYFRTLSERRPIYVDRPRVPRVPAIEPAAPVAAAPVASAPVAAAPVAVKK